MVNSVVWPLCLLSLAMPAGILAALPRTLTPITNTSYVTATSLNSSQDDLVQQMLRLVIGDAAAVRLKSFTPNASSECVWPRCSPVCAPCAKTNKYWTCIVDKSCQTNSECVIASCFAEPGYCYADAYPQEAVCNMGAEPPRQYYPFNGQVLRFGLAPNTPLPGEPISVWYDWAVQSILAPVIYLLIGLGIGIGTGYLVVSGKGARLTCLPPSPVPVIILTIVCLVVIMVAEILRQHQLSSDFLLVRRQIGRTKLIIREGQDLVQQLIDSEVQYNASLNAAAGTCGQHNPLATGLVDMLAGALTSQFNEVHVMLKLVSETMDEGQKLIDVFVERDLTPAEWWIRWGPSIPPMIFFLSLAGLAVAVTVSRSFKFDAGLAKMSPCISGFIFLSAVLAALLLYLGIAISGVCLNVDYNLVLASEQTNLNAVVQEKYDVNPIVQHLARYYVLGLNVNPLATILQNLQAVLHTVLNFYQQFQWIVDLAAASCPGLTKLNPAPLVEVLLHGVDEGFEVVSAANIWHYYHAVVHETICRNVPKLLIVSWLLSTLLSFVLIPILVLMADRHLQSALQMDRASVLNIDEWEQQELKFRYEETGESVESQLDSLDDDHQALLLDRLLHSRSRKVSDALEQLRDPDASSDSN